VPAWQLPRDESALGAAELDGPILQGEAGVSPAASGGTEQQAELPADAPQALVDGLRDVFPAAGEPAIAAPCSSQAPDGLPAPQRELCKA
jgi:hypothetical protein